MSKRTTAAALSVVLGALAVAGCEHHYVYRPTVATTSAVAGQLASYYAIPPESPRGSVQLATFGFADIQPSGERRRAPCDPHAHGGLEQR